MRRTGVSGIELSRPCDALHPLQTVLLLKPEPDIDGMAGRGRIEPSDRHVLKDCQRFAQQARADAGTAMRGVNEHHRHPAERPAVPDGRDTAHDIRISCVVNRHAAAVGVYGKKEFPIVTRLIPLRAAAQSKGGRDVISAHGTQSHDAHDFDLRGLFVLWSRLGPSSPVQADW